MPFGSNRSMRSAINPVQNTLNLLESDEPLPDDDPKSRNGGLKPNRKADQAQIQFYVQLRQSGSISDTAWNRLIQRNPESAVLFSQVAAPGQPYKDYFDPGRPEIGTPGTGGSGDYSEPPTDASPDYQPEIAPKADYQGAILAAAKRNDFQSAEAIKKLFDPNQGSDAKLSTTILGARAVGIPVKGFNDINPEAAKRALDMVQSLTSFEMITPEGDKRRIIGPKSQFAGGVNVPTTKTTSQEIMETQRGARAIIGRANSLVDKLWTANDVTDALKQAASLKTRELKGNDPDVSNYNSLRNGFMAPLIRALGEKGALAEGDVERAKMLWPAYNDTKPVAKAKLKQIETIFDGIVTGKFDSLDQAVSSVVPANSPEGSVAPNISKQDAINELRRRGVIK